jgi:NAD(P)-dependent dehydrogenase (short-subunit alcohol dehydrogenase family)
MAQGFLSGKVAVVTGGGRGIGAETARALARCGARVAIGDVDLQAAEQTAAGLPGGAVARRLDVTDRPGFTAFLDEVESQLGPVHVLVNNAGIMPLARIEDEPDDVTLRQLEINLHAVIHGTREAVRRMRPRAAGVIVNVASSLGKAGVPGAATYCATKHGVVGFSEAVWMELRGSGIYVCCVMPALVHTELAAGIPDARGMRSVQPQDVAVAIVDAVRTGRFDVYVPRAVGGLVRLTALLPRRAREGVARALKADHVLLDAITSAERIPYERRAAASAPSLDRLAGVGSAEDGASCPI